MLSVPDLATAQDTTLSALSLSEGRAIDFSSDDTVDKVYSTGVANVVDSVTVTATATASGASVTIARSDHLGFEVDPATTGHQVSLEVGFNLITVTVSHSGASRKYHVVVGRESLAARGWQAVKDFEVLEGTERASGIWSNGTTMWVADSTAAQPLDSGYDACDQMLDEEHVEDPTPLTGTAPRARIYAYNLATKARDSSNDFTDLDCANTHIGAIWSDRTTMWVSDWYDGMLYAYKMSDKSRDETEDFDFLVSQDNVGGWGLWSNGTTMWVADVYDEMIYAYKMSDRTPDPSKDFDLETLSPGVFGSPRGIWSDGTTMWVVDSIFDKIRAYKMSDKSRDSSKDFDSPRDTQNLFPRNLWSFGKTMWLSFAGSDGGNPFGRYRNLKKIYSFDATGVGAPQPPSVTGGTLSIADNTAPEDSGTIDFTITLARRGTSVVTVAYATSGGTATENVDYRRTQGTLRFAADETSKTISVPVTNDQLNEDSETFTVELSNPSNARVSRATATGTITDNDLELPTLSIEDSSVVEDAGPIQFTVRLEPASGRQVTVTYATSGGTATQNQDYDRTSATLTFAAGERLKTIPVTVTNDTFDEDPETFTVALSSPLNATLSPDDDEATGTIIDDDGPPSLSIAGAAASESDRRIGFKVTLAPASILEVTVSYTTQDGTGPEAATAGEDYDAADDALTFSAGQTEKTIFVTVTDDDFNEVDETFTVILSNPTNAELLSNLATAQGTIEDDDLEPVLSIADASASEILGAIEFTVSLNPASGKQVRVTYATSSGTAMEGVDYTPKTGALIFDPGDESKTISVTVNDDALNEADETFTVTLSSPTNATLSSSATSATGRIQNDDPVPGISLLNQNLTKSEDQGSIDFTVTLAEQSGQRVTVSYETADGTARAGADYTETSGLLTFQPGRTSETISVPLKNDMVFEGPETFTLGLFDPSNAMLTTAEITGTITDDNADTESTAISLSVAPSTVSEGGGSQTVTVTAELDQSARTEDTVVRVTVVGTGASDVVGFDPVQAFNVTIPVGRTSAQGDFTLTPTNDNIASGDETLTVSGAAGELTVTVARLTLKDNDGTATSITLSVEPTRVSEAEQSRTVTVTARLDGIARTVNTVVSVDVSASTGVVDFSAAPASFNLTIPANSDSGEASFTLTPTNDNVASGDETVTVSGSAQNLSVSSVTLTLQDDDVESTEVILSVNPDRVSEANGQTPVTVTVTATLNRGERTDETVVQITVSGSGATDVVGFSALPSSFPVTIPPEMSDAATEFTLTLVDNAIDERNETLTLSGSTTVPNLDVRAARLTLTDDDGPSPPGPGPPVGPDEGVTFIPDSEDTQELRSARGDGALGRLAPTAAQFAIWTDKPGYTFGQQVLLYRTMDPMEDENYYTLFYYRENIETGERRYFAAGLRSTRLLTELVDHYGMSEPDFRIDRMERIGQQLIWAGTTPEPGLWHFVAELRGPDTTQLVKKVFAKFVVVQDAPALVGTGTSTTEIAMDTTWTNDTIHKLRAGVLVKSGATLAIEPGALILAQGHNAAITVEKGGRIVAEGRPESPVVMTCDAKLGKRQPGCWGGLTLRGNAPIANDQGSMDSALSETESAYGGDDPNDSSGALRFVRVEFAGGGSDPANRPAALGLHGVGSGTVIEHVQVHESLGDGIAFRGGTAHCGFCVSSGAQQDSLDWAQGWRGTAQYMYLQQGPQGQHGIGASDGADPSLRLPVRPALYNVTLIGGASLGAQSSSGDGIRLGGGATILARNVVLTGFGGFALDVRGNSVAPFMGGDSSLRNAILHANGNLQGAAQINGGIDSYVEFMDTDPMLLHVRYEANPDPRPKSGSAPLVLGASAVPPSDGPLSSAGEYVGAFGTKNWLTQWTFFGAESDYDVRPTN